MTSPARHAPRLATALAVALAATFALAPAPAAARPTGGTAAAGKKAAAKRLVLDRFKGTGRSSRTTNYDDYREASLELLRRFPPDRFYIVGVGRSPSGVIAYLKSLSLDSAPESGDVSPLAASIPASGLKAGIPRGSAAEFDRHFERFLPDDVKRGERQIVLIDLLANGTSVRNLAGEVDRWLSQRGVNTPAVRSGFIRPYYAARVRDFQFIDDSRFPRANASDGGGIGEYGSHQIGYQRLEDLTPNPSHIRFRRDLLADMKDDAVLAERLRTEFKGLVRGAAVKMTKKATGRPPSTGKKGIRGLKNPYLGQVDFNQALAAARYTVTRKGTDYAILAGSQYADLREGVLDLVDLHAPSDTLYVGVGRSSSAVLGFLQNLGAETAYLPLDGLKDDYDVLTQRPNSPEAIAVRAALTDTIARFLPGDAAIGNRKIVLFQHTSTGASLPVASDQVKAVLAARGAATQVDTVAFASRAASAGRIDIGGRPGLQQLGGDMVRAIGVYGYHRAGTTSSKVLKKPRSEFDDFKTQLADVMATDYELSERLTNGR